MLSIKDQEYFDAVKEFAEKIGKKDQLQQQLDYLANYGGEGATECVLFRDFAPYSFSFVMHKLPNKEFKFNGGVIFHGKHDGGGNGSFPTLSVCLEEADGWEIHT